MEEGADPRDVDKACVEFGFPMGPVSLGDMVGHQLFYNQRKAKKDMNAWSKVSMPPFDLVNWMNEKGFVGQKAGKGTYNYDPKTRKKTGLNAEVVAQMKVVQQ